MWLYAAILLVSMVGGESVDKGPSIWQERQPQTCYIVADEDGTTHEYCVVSN